MGDTLPQNRLFTEHVVFVLLLLPTLVVLVAAVVSLAFPEPIAAVQASAQTAAACEPCKWREDGEEGP